MTLPLIAVAIILSALVGMALLYPWIRSIHANSHEEPLLREIQTLQFEREMILQNLQDLQLDFNAQKIETSDYEQLREKFLQEASQIYSALEKIESDHPILQKIEQLAKEHVS